VSVRIPGQSTAHNCGYAGSQVRFSLSGGDAGVNGVAEGNGHSPLGAGTLDDGDEESWWAVRDSNPRLPD